MSYRHNFDPDGTDTKNNQDKMSALPLTAFSDLSVFTHYHDSPPVSNGNLDNGSSASEHHTVGSHSQIDGQTNSSVTDDTRWNRQLESSVPLKSPITSNQSTPMNSIEKPASSVSQSGEPMEGKNDNFATIPVDIAPLESLV
jgi:hypothetical protein